MRRITLTIFALAACMLLVQSLPATAKSGKERKPKKVKLKTELDSVSFSLGIDIAGSVINFMDGNGPVDYDKVIDGMNYLFDTGWDASVIGEAVKFLEQYYTVRFPAKQLKETENILSNILLTTPGLEKSPSGLVYKILEQGDLYNMPDEHSRVRVSYQAYDADGEEFDSNDDTVFNLSNVVKGFAEGCMKIGVGGKIKLWVHPSLGYGERGLGPVKANSLTIYDISLLALEPLE